MFGKLKNKLKDALSLFSTRSEEEAETISQEEIDRVIKESTEPSQKSTPASEVEEEPKEKKKKEQKENPLEEEQNVVETKEEKPAQEITKEEAKEIQDSKQENLIQDKKEKEPVTESVSEEPTQEEPIPQTIPTPIIEVQEKEVPTETPAKKEKEQSIPTPQDLVQETKEKYEHETVAKKEEIPTPDELVKKTKEEFEGPKKKPFAEQLLTEEIEDEPAEEKKSFFGKLRKSLVGDTKKEDKPEEETQGFFSKVTKAISTKKISSEKFDELFWDLELILLENNVSVKVIEKIKDDLREELVDKPLPRDVLAKIQETLQRTLHEILTTDPIDVLAKIKEKEGPYVIAFFGVNGAGKTTSIAKLTHYLKKQNHSVVLAACDTFRAAAIQQLEEHATKLDVKMIKHDYGSDAAAVAYDAIQYAQKNNVDVVLIDTAGRLHSNTNLMAELEKIIRVTEPDLKVFVGESITGNDCVEQAEKFNELVQMDGAILTKADVDEKGGAPLSISYTINKPILFLGIGQEYDDFVEFNVNTMISRLGF